MSWTNLSKNSSNWTNNTKSNTTGTVAGNPIGLLLSLTYATDNTSTSTSWGNASKNSASWTNLSKS